MPPVQDLFPEHISPSHSLIGGFYASRQSIKILHILDRMGQGWKVSMVSFICAPRPPIPSSYLCLHREKQVHSLQCLVL